MFLVFGAFRFFCSFSYASKIVPARMRMLFSSILLLAKFVKMLYIASVKKSSNRFTAHGSSLVCLSSQKTSI